MKTLIFFSTLSIFSVIFTTSIFGQSSISKIKINSNYNKEGKLDGIQTYHHDNGKVFAKYEYVYGSIWNVLILNNKKGKKLNPGSFKDGWGVLFTYNKKGKLIQKASYMTGMLNGVMYKYKDDKIIDSIFYKNDIIFPFPTQSDQ